MGNRWQRVWGFPGRLLGLWSTSWPSLWWRPREFHYLFIIPLWCIRLSFIITLMYGTPWWYYCNLSACVCDWFLGTHEFCAFNFILKIGCDTRGSITNNIQSKVDFKISMEISVIWQSISSYQKLVKHWSLLE